jgi:HPt (histidine-containing phosphotransfer) domain-containing protein
METAQASALASAMNRLWSQYLPELEERVAVLQSAAAALREGALTADLRAQAASAAHKLAGVLGTFGLSEGTDRAREAERFYSGEDRTDRMTPERLAQIPVELLAMMAARK